MIDQLTELELKTFLDEHKDWAIADDGQSIARKFKFNDFRQAMDFMNRVADIANAIDHHPDWCNSYHRVEVSLTTHAINALSPRDLTLAQSMDAIAATMHFHA